MSLLLVAQLISLVANILTILIFVWVIASWILAPYHPVREALDRIVEPLLAPIRRLIPQTGPVDFSPMILIILIFLLEQVLYRLVRSLGCLMAQVSPSRCKAGAALAVRVTPRASKNRIVEVLGDGTVKIQLTAPPVDGEANAKLIAFLAAVLDISKSRIEIVAGATGRGCDRYR
jgi:uncharacterized protein (TIGR00251 family)